MSIALTTLVVVILLTPGILFRAFLIKSEALENPLDTSFKTELIIILIFSIPLQLGGYLVVDYFDAFDIQQFYYFLAGSEKFNEELIQSSWLSFIGYSFLLMSVSVMFGYSLRLLILWRFLDLRWKTIPISNEWDNILSGRLNQHSRIDNLKRARKEFRIHRMVKSENFESHLKSLATTFSRNTFNRNRHQRSYRKALSKDQNDAVVLAMNNYESLRRQAKIGETALIQLLAVQENAQSSQELDDAKSNLSKILSDLEEEFAKQEKIKAEVVKDLLIQVKAFNSIFAGYHNLNRFGRIRVMAKFYLDSNNKVVRNAVRGILYTERFRKKIQIKKIYKERIDFLWVEGLVEVNNEIILYRGKLQKYYLAKNNSLSKIVLSGTGRKRIISPTGPPSNANSAKELSYHGFESNEFIIPFEHIKNLNVNPTFILKI